VDRTVSYSLKTRKPDPMKIQSWLQNLKKTVKTDEAKPHAPKSAAKETAKPTTTQRKVRARKNPEE